MQPTNPSPAPLAPGLPSPANNQADALGAVTGPSIARNILEFHRRGLRASRYRHLTAEKYLLHIDGEGFAQWLDLFDGERLAIPFTLDASARMQDNLLRPCVDHMVAYHTSQPYQFVSEPKDDRKARERSLIDQIFINHLVTRQRLNTVVAAALYMGAGAGHTPLHAYWRSEQETDTYEPVMSGGMEQDPLSGMMQMPARGMIDFFVGDPFGTVYHPGSKRTSVPMYTYERVLPASLVRQAFPGVDLEGSDKLPSASRYVRTVRNWMVNAAFVHGFGGMMSGEGNEELLGLLYQEIAPGVDPANPDGRLRILALQGAAEINQETATGRGAEPILLHDEPLPGGCLSSVRLYTHPGGRQDDVWGKPFVADLDDDQVELNQALTERKRYLLKATNAPLVTEEAFDQETDTWEDGAQLEVEPGTRMQPYHLEPPFRHIQALNQHIEDLKAGLFTKAGYNAASRGESRSGDAAAKVIALSRLDDTVHGPTNTRLREDLEDYCGIAWRLMKQYGDVPWIIDNIGAEHAHLVGSYIDRSMLSERPPSFRMVSGFGATPEARAEQLLRMVQMTGADGEVLMSTKQFRAAWPDRTLYPEHEDPMGIRERRPKVINAAIRTQVEQILKGMAGQGIQPQVMELLAPAIEAAIRQEYPILPDDILPLHVQELGNITQDETENRIVRRVASLRQAQLRALIQQLQMQAMAGRPPEGASGGGPPPAGPRPASGEQATATPRPGEVQALTREAQGA